MKKGLTAITLFFLGIVLALSQEGEFQKEISKGISDISSEELGRNNIVLFGTPNSNKILASLSDILPIKMGNKEIKVGDKVYEGENIGVIMLLPNPYNKDKFLLIYSAFAPYLQENIQSIFHGPTDYVIFSEDPPEKGATRVVEVGFFLKSSPTQWKTFSSPPIE